MQTSRHLQENLPVREFISFSSICCLTSKLCVCFVQESRARLTVEDHSVLRLHGPLNRLYITQVINITKHSKWIRVGDLVRKHRHDLDHRSSRSLVRYVYEIISFTLTISGLAEELVRWYVSQAAIHRPLETYITCSRYQGHSHPVLHLAPTN